MRRTAVGLLLALACSSAPALEITLGVEEPIGIERRSAPVSSGVCLPRGRFPADQPFALFDGEREVALQTTPLVVERDGTLRWVLLDFQLDIGPNELRRLRLKTQKPRARPGEAIASEHLWLYDMSHKTAEIWVDFAAQGDPDAYALSARERFPVEGVPDGFPLYFALVSFDDSNNRSFLSNVARAEGKQGG